uniref:Uncharacterized protein n=1 Tax=Cyanistes caeruleus TaxID=156563 RepID=A0A8C0Z8E1_CYACU
CNYLSENPGTGYQLTAGAGLPGAVCLSQEELQGLSHFYSSIGPREEDMEYVAARVFLKIGKCQSMSNACDVGAVTKLLPGICKALKTISQGCSSVSQVPQTVQAGGAGTAPVPSVPGTAPVPSVPGTAPVPSVPGTDPVPPVPGTAPAPVPSVPGTAPAPVPSVPGTAPVPSVPGTDPVPSVPGTSPAPVPPVPGTSPVPPVPGTSPVPPVPGTSVPSVPGTAPAPVPSVPGTAPVPPVPGTGTAPAPVPSVPGTAPPDLLLCSRSTWSVFAVGPWVGALGRASPSPAAEEGTVADPWRGVAVPWGVWG